VSRGQTLGGQTEKAHLPARRLGSAQELAGAVFDSFRRRRWRGKGVGAGQCREIGIPDLDGDRAARKLLAVD
jgi:hypothetical protein